MPSWETDHLLSTDVGGTRLVAVVADLTAIDVDAVVNAANEHLAHGGGVARALARAGGPQVQRDSDAWVTEHGPVQPGQAAVTTAGDMPADHIVHVVGPRYRDDQDNAGMLGAAVEAALTAAAAAGARTVALPAISAGIFGYPPAEAADVIARTCVGWLTANGGTLDAVVLVGYDQRAGEQFATAIRGTASHET